MPARTIHDLVRAVSDPWPGAFCDTPRGRVTVWQTGLLEPGAEARSREPGSVFITAAGRPAVQAGSGSLELLRYDAPILRDGEGFATGELLSGGSEVSPHLQDGPVPEATKRGSAA